MAYRLDAHSESSASAGISRFDSAIRTQDRRALLIAFHYPPCQESSGYLRTLGFSRYLPDFGWNPVLLTANVRAYPRTSNDHYDKRLISMPVKRAFALDARKHLSIRHMYPSLLDVPDRWSSWWLGAVPAGLSLIRRYRPDVIWATQPILTAFSIAQTLHRLTGIPWVADFRDPTGVDSDERGFKALVRGRIERRTMRTCACAVFTTPGAARVYKERYPDLPNDRVSVVQNGYDESNFTKLDDAVAPPEDRPLRLVHGGILYRDHRDPRPLFDAVANLKKKGRVSADLLQIILRASGFEELYRAEILKRGIADIVLLEPLISHQQALREVASADGLLILQGKTCNNQIPAKAYEYLRAKRPILALTDADGDTARLLSASGINTLVSLDSSAQIEDGLMRFIEGIRNKTAVVAPDNQVRRHSRKARAAELADIFNEVAIA